jgi:hypothetical protein
MIVTVLCGCLTLKQDDADAGAPLLGRNQTDEWKGWMQCVFIMYHYYRARFVYNEVRVLVSCYVWMTGFGNYSYFMRKKNFSASRVLATVLRINWLALGVMLANGTGIMLYYIVPLTTGCFFMTYVTCWCAHTFGRATPWAERTSLFVCLLALVVFFEILHVPWPSHEAKFRFHLDKYSAWIGMFCAHLLHHWKNAHSAGPMARTSPYFAVAGALMVVGWFALFGTGEKYWYNERHPYIVVFPIVGYVLLRNAHPAMRRTHSVAFATLGRYTLETYVLQFHIFMCHNVRHIIVVIGEDRADYPLVNTLVVGAAFLAVSVFARKLTLGVTSAATRVFGTQKLAGHGRGQLSDGGIGKNTRKALDVEGGSSRCAPETLTTARPPPLWPPSASSSSVFRMLLAALCGGTMIAALHLISANSGVRRLSPSNPVVAVEHITRELATIQSHRGHGFVEAFEASHWTSQHFPGALASVLFDGASVGNTVLVSNVGGSASAPKHTYLESFVKGIVKLQSIVSAATQTSKDLPPASPPHTASRVESVNPSAGFSGSVWGAMHLDTIIPRRTDIVVWEMGINDWDPNDSKLPRRVWHQQAFELFVRRALSINPKIIIIIVSLWQSIATECWPHCPDDRGEFDDIVEVAEKYAFTAGVPFFALDFNRMSKLLRIPAEDLFRDAHHPSLAGHHIMGDALRFGSFLSSMRAATQRALGVRRHTTQRVPAVKPRCVSCGRNGTCSGICSVCNVCEEKTSAAPGVHHQSFPNSEGLGGADVMAENAKKVEMDVCPMGPNIAVDCRSVNDLPLVSFDGSVTHGNGLLAAALDVNRHIWSVFYGTPTFGASMQEIHHDTGTKTIPFGKVSTYRLDRKYHVLIPRCDLKTPLRYDIPMRHPRLGTASRVEFVGINLRKSDGGIWRKSPPDRMADVVVTVGDWTANLLTEEDMKGAGVLRRGFLEPQAWFRVASQTSISDDLGTAGMVRVHVCLGGSDPYGHALGSIAFF